MVTTSEARRLFYALTCFDRASVQRADHPGFSEEQFSRIVQCAEDRSPRSCINEATQIDFESLDRLISPSPETTNFCRDLYRAARNAVARHEPSWSFRSHWRNNLFMRDRVRPQTLAEAATINYYADDEFLSGAVDSLAEDLPGAVEVARFHDSELQGRVARYSTDLPPEIPATQAPYQLRIPGFSRSIPIHVDPRQGIRDSEMNEFLEYLRYEFEILKAFMAPEDLNRVLESFEIETVRNFGSLPLQLPNTPSTHRWCFPLETPPMHSYTHRVDDLGYSLRFRGTGTLLHFLRTMGLAYHDRFLQEDAVSQESLNDLMRWIRENTSEFPRMHFLRSDWFAIEGHHLPAWPESVPLFSHVIHQSGEGHHELPSSLSSTKDFVSDLFTEWVMLSLAQDWSRATSRPFYYNGDPHLESRKELASIIFSRPFRPITDHTIQAAYSQLELPSMDLRAYHPPTRAITASAGVLAEITGSLVYDGSVGFGWSFPARNMRLEGGLRIGTLSNNFFLGPYASMSQRYGRLTLGAGLDLSALHNERSDRWEFMGRLQSEVCFVQSPANICLLSGVSVILSEVDVLMPFGGFRFEFWQDLPR